MRIHGAKGPSTVGALNLTSMIDCCFLLLIFFISTLQAPKLEANIQAYLPKTSPAAKGAGSAIVQAKKEESNVVQIALRHGQKGGLDILLNGAQLDGGFFKLNGALAALRHVIETTPSVKTEIIIDADPVVPYRHVVTTLDLCGKHRFTDISFAMPPKDKATPP